MAAVVFLTFLILDLNPKKGNSPKGLNFLLLVYLGLNRLRCIPDRLHGFLLDLQPKNEITAAWIEKK